MARRKPKANSVKKEQGSIDRLLAFVEKDRFTVITGTLYLLLLGVVRSYTESTIFEYRGFSYYLLADHIFAHVPILLIAAFLSSHLAKIPFKTVFNVSMLGMSLVMLPPFIDRFIFGLSGAEFGGLYEFFFPSTPLSSLFSGNVLDNISPGLMIMFSSLLLLMGLYIYVKTKSPVKTFITCFQILAVILFIGFLPFVFVYVFPENAYNSHILLFSAYRHELNPQYYQYLTAYGPYFEDTVSGIMISPYARYVQEQQRSISMIAYLMILTLGASMAILYKYYKNLLRDLLGRLDWGAALMVASAALGVATVVTADPDYSKGLALKFDFLPHLSYIILILLIVVFAWMFISMRHGMSKKLAGKTWHLGHAMSRYQYVQVSHIFAALALLLSALMGWIVLALTVALLFLAFIPNAYAGSKDRMPDRMLKSVKRPLPWAVILSFFIGFFSPSMWLLVAPRLNDIRRIPGTTEIFIDWSEDVVVNIWIPRVPEINIPVLLTVTALAIAAVVFLSIPGNGKKSEQEEKVTGKRNKSRRR